jgi:hypothetical protein
MGARPAVIPKINRADYEAGINPLYKGLIIYMKFFNIIIKILKNLKWKELR